MKAVYLILKSCFEYRKWLCVFFLKRFTTDMNLLQEITKHIRTKTLHENVSKGNTF